MIKRIITIIVAVSMLSVLISGCGSNDREEQSTNTNTSETIATDDNKNELNYNELPDLQVRFGEKGEIFTLKLYDNDTAKEIARSVGTSDWNLPIYNFDNYENWEVMQFYDIPSRYNIPSNSEVVTSQKAGEVYYSEPNRIILFYQDAEVTGEYTKVGYIESIDGLLEAVENNPEVPGWGNKIVSITSMK